MARSVRVGDFQAMQRKATNGADDGQVAEAEPTLTVPEQLAALEIHATPGSAYADVVKRIRTRCTLLDITALDEEIAAEARRRCGMLPEPTPGADVVAQILAEKHGRGLHAGFVVGGCGPCAAEPTAEDAIAAAEGLPLYADAPDEVIMSLGQDDPAGDGPELDAADMGADLLHGSEESDYPTVCDLPCDRCGGEVILRSEEEDHLLASRVAQGIEIEVLCDGCATADSPVEPKAEDRADDELDPLTGMPEDTLEFRLRGLYVEARCTAEMSLSMIVGRVKDAAFAAKLDPTDAEVVAEAERIWATFNDNRRGPREATVNADGTVRDWRRPDTTPDRGPDVGTTHHTITDETRFSGAGAEDGQQASMFMVPNDADFKGKLYRDAPELANIAETLIDRHGFLAGLENCEIRWYWKRKTGVSKGRVKIGFMKRASDLLGHFSGADFIGWLSATTARDGKFTDTQIEAAVFHQLCHVDADDKGNWIFAPHDFEGFAQEVRHYGTWTENLKLGGTAFVAAHQMGLFTDSDDDEDEDGDEGE